MNVKFEMATEWIKISEAHQRKSFEYGLLTILLLKFINILTNVRGN